MSLLIFFNYFKSILNTWKLSSNILKQILSECVKKCTAAVTDIYLFQNLAATPNFLFVIFVASS